MMPLRIAAVFGVLFVASLAGVPPAASAQRRVAGPETGLAAIHFAKAPPNFTFDTPEGPRTLAALAGRPVVVNFWATWCGPCQAEMGAFASLRRAYGDAVPLVTISEDATPGAAAAYLRAHGVVGAISIDDPERKIFGLYTVVPIPTTLVLAPDGTVTHVSIGELDWVELQGAVTAAMQAGGLTLPPAFDTVGANAGTRTP